MEHTTAAHGEHHETGTKEIWKTFWILLFLTLIELGFGYSMIGMKDGGLLTGLRGVIIILMLAKAFYIVAYFMHLKHELKNLIMTIVVPLFLFIWFIVAFLYDGNSYKNLRNKYDSYYHQRSMEQAPAHESSHGAEKAHGEEKHEMK